MADENNKYKFTKIEFEDGTVSDAILLSVDAEYIKFNRDKNLLDAMAERASREIFQDKNIIFENNISIEDAEEVYLFGEGNETNDSDIFAIGKDNKVLVEEESESEESSNEDIISKNPFLKHNSIEGEGNIIINSYTVHAEGQGNSIKKSGYSHIEGYHNSVFNDVSDYESSHTEGGENVNNGMVSFVYGSNNIIDIEPEEYYTEATSGALCIGSNNYIKNYANICLGTGLNNTFKYLMIRGTYNEILEIDKNAEDRIEYGLIVGNGTSDEDRHDAFKIDTKGNCYITGNLIAPILLGGFYGKFDKIKNDNGLPLFMTSFVKRLGDCRGKNITFYNGDGYIRKRPIRNWQFQRIRDKFDLWENKDQIILYGDDIVDENENIIRERDKDYTVLYETNLINTMKIIEEVSGDTEKGDIIYITKATKKTNDALILIQLHTECEQGINQDDAVIKIDLDIDNKSLKNWMPIRSLTPGTHIIDLHCPIKDMELDKIYNFKLKARCTSGKITIDKNKIKVLVYGEGTGFVQGITIPEEETEEEGE